MTTRGERTPAGARPRRALVGALLVAAVLAAGALAATPAQARTKEKCLRPADVILTNARIYTVDHCRPWARVVAIRGDRIVYVGDGRSRAWKRFVGPKTAVLDMHGRLVLPGMIDSHTHPAAVAMSSWHTLLPWTYDPDEQLTYLKNWCAQHPEQKVVYAVCYPDDMFPADSPPTAAMIDAYVSDRPVIWEAFSDHACCLNTAAMQAMGINKDTPDPPSGAGYFQRDADGNPTGYVTEGAWWDYADNMYAAVGWWPPTEATPENLSPFLDFLSSKGECAIFDAVIEGEATLQSVATLEKQGKLNMYYEGAVVFDTLADLPENIAQLRDWQAKYTSKHIHIRTMKLFLDGTNEIGTSAVLQPFSNDPTGTDYGQLNMSEDDLVKCLLILNKEKLDLHIHMVGDRAFRTACNAVEKARAQLGRKWRIQVTFAHCELIDPADMPRVARLGIIINWSPHWSGGYFGTAAADWLGWDRFNRMYQFNTIIRSGGIVDYGSDVVGYEEANRADPFFGMQVGKTRIDPEFPLPDCPGVVPGTAIRQPLSARLSIPDLIKGYTLNGAIQLRMAGNMGSITVGKLANMVVLNKDLFSVPDDQISSVQPEAVLFEGKVVHGTLVLP